MSNDPSARQAPPQASQMGSFSFQAQPFQQREMQKNYVFVDEHNRHKRLKVMRACEGCRRRKIKCDAATTNTWPCSACIRLRLHCVRPNSQFDETGDTYDTSPPAADFPGQMAMGQQHHQHQQPPPMMPESKPSPAMYAAQSAYPDNPNAFQPLHYSESPTAQQSFSYPAVGPSVPVMGAQQYDQPQHIPSPPQQHGSKGSSPNDTYSQADSYQGQDLSDLLGSLKMDEAGSAPYLRNKASFRQEEEPAIEEVDDYKIALPPIPHTPGLKIRIPPELMPDNATVMHYFDLFFTNVHPHVPVLCKTTFYQQWHSKRETISPLILEAIFAISGRLADEPAQGQQWLALVTSHADAFMDVPRLSTLQALLIILKAREAAPKRGYYYRSWMTVVQCVQMSKDLGLDDHFSDHQVGRPCGSSPFECQLKTRIWQTVFVCEVMIGSPQGRTDLAVEVDSVDFGIPRHIPGGDESEYHISRNFTYLARIVQHVSKMNSVYGRLKKKKKDWGTDPEFVQLNPLLNSWIDDLPGDLSVTFPPDGSPPWLSSPFIGNLHSYYYLSLILLHRPQLAMLDPNGADGLWKSHMMICYSSAKALCRLQEAVLGTFGLTGLQSMQRGFSFTVYCGLTCIVLHLVAITSPDAELHTDARDYFARHMRVLEKVMSAWPMADLQKQVDAVREAFSVDIRKPFVLKPSFPYGSPHSSNQSVSPRMDTGYRPATATLDRTGLLGHHQLDTQNLHQQQQHAQVSYTNHPLTPPISAGPVDSKSDSPGVQSLAMMANQGSQADTMPPTMPLTDAPTWNPQRIFEQWNTSFGTAQIQHPPPLPTSVPSQGGGALDMSPPTAGQSATPSMPGMAAGAAGVNMPMSAQQMAQHQQPQYSTPPVQTFVTPAMWQESVASVYEGGFKRAWDYDQGGPVMKRQR